MSSKSMLDTRRTVETPEGVELELRVVGPAVRFYAWLIDFAIRAGIYFVLAMVLPTFGSFGVGILLILIFLLEWFYPVVYEIYRNGMTPGKKSMGVRVVHDDGTEVSVQASVIRNLLRSADFLPFAYGFGLLSMLISRDFKRLGDLAAGTLVVYCEPKLKDIDIEAATPLAPPIPLDADEQHAVMQFAERAQTLNPERANELAGTLEKVTGEKGDGARQRLYQYANWLVGRR